MLMWSKWWSNEKLTSCMIIYGLVFRGCDVRTQWIDHGKQCGSVTIAPLLPKTQLPVSDEHKCFSTDLAKHSQIIQNSSCSL